MVNVRGRTRESPARSPLPAGATAPSFALADSPHSRVALDDFRGRPVVLVFYVADWHPVATDQLSLFQQLLPHLERLDAVVLGISVDATWSHAAFARAHGIHIPLLSDDEPPGAVARMYGVHVPETGRSRRALFVIDGQGVVHWSAVFHEALNPGADGVLSALEDLRPTADSGGKATEVSAKGAGRSTCPCGCGLSTTLVGTRNGLPPSSARVADA